MKRPRRHKFISAGVFFLVYSTLIAVSQKTETTPPEVVATLRGYIVKPDVAESSTFGPTLEPNPEEESSSISTTKPNVHTLRPRRVNCTAPAIEQYPRPLIRRTIRRRGGLIINILLAIFSFLGLAIVCDDYFVSSLYRICEKLKLSPDVAGATFMAAGSSAPELVTAIIAVFFGMDDIGISYVVGSSVFNIMFVISICALCSGTVSYLNWWPLCRDCFIYAISILVMLFTISNEFIGWPEAVIMMLMYVVYCVVLHFNTPLERWAMSLKLPIKLPTKEEQASLVTYKTAVIPDTKTAKKSENGENPGGPASEEHITIQPNQVGYSTVGDDYETYYNDQECDPNASWREQDDAPAGQASVLNLNRTWEKPESPAQQHQASQELARTANLVQQAQPTIQAAGIPKQNCYRPKEYKPEELVNPLIKPTDAGVLGLAAWYIVFPIHFLCRKTIPDCRSEKYRSWYPLTFIVSVIWITFYSYVMVWMITIIGSTLRIPDTVMGLTFVAAGVSVLDALSSIAVIKEGYGDMAVSNAFGSNVFDILICLGLPWFIQTAIIKPGSHVNVTNKGLTYSTLSLLGTVIFLLLATHLNGWKLDRKYGIILMIWYLIFITFASLYEMNIFGDLHLPECMSLY